MAFLDVGGGDIWSTGAFSFESPMKDLLDGGEYTLEQLLREDELLQEVKSMQPQLIDFLAQSSSMSLLVRYLVTPLEKDGGGEAAEVKGGGVQVEDGIEYEGDGRLGTDELLEALEQVTQDDDDDDDEEENENQEAALESTVAKEPSDDAPSGEADKTQQDSPQETTMETITVDQNTSTDTNTKDTPQASETPPANPPSSTHSTSPAEEDLHQTPTVDDDNVEEHVSADHDAEPMSSDSIHRPANEDTSSTDLPASACETQPTAEETTTEELPPSATTHAEPHSEEDPNTDNQTNDTTHDGQHSEHHDHNNEEEEEEEEEPTSDEDEEEDRSLRHIRYPYMACEIVCCENARIVDLLVDGKDDQGVGFLDRLFGILDLEVGLMDDRLAGYFEKVLSVLFRMRSSTLSEYINTHGDSLLPKFIRHLGSFSIMQVLWKLLIPERPNIMENDPEGMGGPMEEDDDDPQEGAEFMDGMVRCSWGTEVSTASVLVRQLIDSGSQDVDVARNASDLLVALVQQASLDSPVLKLLTSHPILDGIVEKATVLAEGDELVPFESTMTSALSLLEAIVLQLGGFGCVPPVNESMSISFTAAATEVEGGEGKVDVTNEDGNLAAKPIEGGTDASNEHAEATSTTPNNRWNEMANSQALTGLLPKGLSALKTLLEDEVAKQWSIINQAGEERLRLGASRLRMVRLVEALVLLAHPEVDEEVIRSNILEVCLSLFFAFEWCNMLHQSVANLIVHVLESGDKRIPLQAHLINDLKLLDRLLEGYEKNEKVCEESSFRLGYMGHLIIVCQAVVHACDPEPQPSTLSTEAVVSSSSAATSISEEQTEVFVNGESKSTDQGGAARVPLKADGEGSAGEPVPSKPTSASNMTRTLSSIVADNSVWKRWESFVSSGLSAVTAIHATPLGGISPPSREALDSPLASHAGDSTGMLEMNDNDLDVAVSMMEALNFSSRTGDMSGDHDDLNGGIELDDKPMVNGGHLDTTSAHLVGQLNFSPSVIDGEKGGSGHCDYYYDDPLGRDVLSRKLGSNDDDDAQAVIAEDDDENDDGYDEDGCGGQDVPVMDLFTGNFNIDSIGTGAVSTEDNGKSEGDAGNASSRRGDAGQDSDASWGGFAAFETPDDRKATQGSVHAEGSGSNEKFAFDANFEANFASFSFDEGDCVDDPSPVTSSVDDGVAQAEENVEPSTENDGAERSTTAVVSDDDECNSGSFVLDEQTPPLDCKSDKGIELKDPFGDTPVRKPSIDELF